MQFYAITCNFRALNPFFPVVVSSLHLTKAFVPEHSDLDMEKPTDTLIEDILFHLRRKRLQKIHDNDNLTEKAIRFIRDLNEVWEKVVQADNRMYVVK